MGKRGFRQPVARCEDKNKQISIRTSAMSSSVLKKEEKETKKQQQKLTFRSQFDKRRTDTQIHASCLAIVVLECILRQP